MAKNKWQKHIILLSLLLTLLIFSFAVLISYALEFIRINEITKTMNDYNIGTDSYLIENDFIGIFGGNRCEVLKSRIDILKKEVEGVGEDLSRYGQKSFFKKQDYDYLKRKYFLLELRLYSWMLSLRGNCEENFIPILFFYNINEDISERQGYILTDLTKDFPSKVFVFSFDYKYEDEPILNLIKMKYNITKAPTILINDKLRFERLIYLKELEDEIRPLISTIDRYSKKYDMTFTLNATNTNLDAYLGRLDKLLNESMSPFAKGDIYLILGRLIKNDNVICQAAEFYKNVSEDNKEEKAIAYETLGSLNCDKNSNEYYVNASKLWKGLGNYFRADIDKNLAENEPLNIYYSISPLPSIKDDPKNWSSITIGSSYFLISDKDKILSQADRVTRDWLSNQLNQSPYGTNLLNVFSEQYTLPESELREDIGWHEGARINELKESGAQNLIASGTIVKKINNTWYAPDEIGIFRFEVPIDKVLYPTTRFLKEDLAVIVDTHGINMLVEQAIRNKATVVVGCCDNPGKIKAAKYLSDKGIKVICFTDKYLPLALGSGLQGLGSPPIKEINSSVLVGERSITINPSDKIVVMNVSSDKFAISYYQTPEIYFTNLQKLIKINPIYLNITDFNQMSSVIDEAEKENANIIAVRVYNKNDYDSVKNWLLEDERHKAILFHSMAYPYGYLILKEFPSQTSFDDINPIIK
jgi:hypothetical protein